MKTLVAGRLALLLICALAPFLQCPLHGAVGTQPPGGAGGGAGDVTTSQLNTASNFVFYSAVLTNQINEGNVVYVRTNGSDSTGLRGRMDKPFLSIGAAATASARGDTIKIGPGVYDFTNLSYTFLHDRIYAGAGMNETIISNINRTIPGSSIVRDLTINTYLQSAYSFPISWTPGDQRFTNALFERVRTLSATDGVYGIANATNDVVSLELRECEIISGWDCVLWSGSTNARVRAVNSVFISDAKNYPSFDNAFQNGRWLILNHMAGGSFIEMENCVFKAFDVARGSVYEENDWGQEPINYVTFRNCSASIHLTNGASLNYDVYSSSMDFTNLVIRFDGLNPQSIRTSAAIYSSGAGPQYVMMTSGIRRTNNLPRISGYGGTNYTGLWIGVIDWSGNAFNSNITVRAQGSATIRGPFGNATTYTINRNYGSAKFRAEGTNWVVEDSTLPAIIDQLTLTGALDATTGSYGTLNVTGDGSFYGGLILANLSAPAVLGMNGSADATNLTLAGGLVLHSSGMVLSNSATASASNNVPFTTYTAVTGSPATNIVIDASLGTVFRVRLTNNMGLLITNGHDAQDLSIELYQDGTGNRTVTHVPNIGGALTNNWQFGEDITSPITLTTNQYKKDLLKLRFEVTNLATNTSRSNWMVIGTLRKYPN